MLQSLSITEILIMAVIVLPCLGILVIGGITVVIILLVRNKKQQHP